MDNNGECGRAGDGAGKRAREILPLLHIGVRQSLNGNPPAQGDPGDACKANVRTFMGGVFCKILLLFVVSLVRH